MSARIMATTMALLAVLAVGASCREPRDASIPPPVAAPPAASSYAAGAVADAGTITGFASSAGGGADALVEITADHAACGGAGGAGGAARARPAGALLVQDGRVANVVVWLEGISSGKPFVPGVVTIDNASCQFMPRVAVGFVGGKVAATNSDPVLHTTSLVFAADGKAIANVALPGVGARVERSLRRAGLVSVRCDTHEWMQGWLHVFDHPYATVTDAAGEFTLADVPAGRHVLRGWHERLGDFTLPVTLAAGEALAVNVALP